MGSEKKSYDYKSSTLLFRWSKFISERTELLTAINQWVDEDEQDGAPDDADPMGGMGGGMPGMGGDGGFGGIG